MGRLKNFYTVLYRLALARNAYLEFPGTSIVVAIDWGFLVVCCKGNGIAHKVVADLDDAHLVSEQSVRHRVKMIQFNFYAALLCKEVVSHKDFEHTLLYAKDFFFLLEAESGNS